MARASDVARSAVVWSALATMVLVAVPPMLLGYPLVLVDPNRAGADRWLRMLARALVRLNPHWRVRVEGTRHLALGGPYVLVINHQSMADLLAMCFLHHDTKYLGKESLFRVPVFGWALRVAGEVPVTRGDHESGSRALEKLGRWLERGVSVAIFPEGTRSKDGAIGPFKLGAFKLAVDKQRPIVPVVISGAGALLPKRSWVVRGEANVWLRVLEPISTEGLGHDEISGLAEVTRARMIAALGELDHRRVR